MPDNQIPAEIPGDIEKGFGMRRKWSLGVLNHREVHDVQGSVLLFSSISQPRTGASDFASCRLGEKSTETPAAEKRTANGMLLEPQPEQSPNDPLNWSIWRRSTALYSLGLYCMLGGGMAPLLAAGFENVAETYHVSIPKIALTTGFYMLGLGIGGVLISPTAIILGKRTVYLASAVVFIMTSIWCAISPHYYSLLVARIMQGVAVSPVEVLPSASVTEIFFLHERAFRLGIYTLLLLSGKNLMPLLSAVIIQASGWRIVFWSVAISATLFLVLLFFFVPETYWDRRTPRKADIDSGSRLIPENKLEVDRSLPSQAPHIDFDVIRSVIPDGISGDKDEKEIRLVAHEAASKCGISATIANGKSTPTMTNRAGLLIETRFDGFEKPKIDFIESCETASRESLTAKEFNHSKAESPATYTDYWRNAPAKTYKQTISLYLGQTSNENWIRVATRPFILFCYPAILWSAIVYSLSLGWLIVVSESVGEIYSNRHSYNFTAFQVGLVYISVFIGGVLGTVIAGRLSDVVVRFMAKRNDGLFEPEFRLVMAIPVALSTTIGLMGFGWTAEIHKSWIVPTVFLGLVGFGCSLGGTLAITYCVDSYRQYAAEALVTLNFSKNVFHGLVFSLFLNNWLEKSGSKKVFISIGCIHVAFLLLTIPMFIYGKRARAWTSRLGLMTKS